jgi:hypothetical protein
VQNRICGWGAHIRTGSHHCGNAAKVTFGKGRVDHSWSRATTFSPTASALTSPAAEAHSCHDARWPPLKHTLPCRVRVVLHRVRHSPQGFGTYKGCKTLRSYAAELISAAASGRGGRWPKCRATMTTIQMLLNSCLSTVSHWFPSGWFQQDIGPGWFSPTWLNAAP